ncbi:CbrC family protein [Streptomyces luteogriseus]|uniref:CbrC family protein n=1 Tax=Streptomyces luteogriseus TaxID=68233 RepID=UPI0037A15266
MSAGGFTAGRLLRPALPDFPYHPDPVATGSVTASDEPCACCGQERGWLYAGPLYGADVPDGPICPYCIASGRAAERHGAFFTDIVDGDVPRDVVTAVVERTPGFIPWQEGRWLTHCGDAAAFLGIAGRAEFELHPDALECLRREYAGVWSPDEVEHFLTSLDRDGPPSAYLFRCRACGTHLAYADFT